MNILSVWFAKLLGWLLRLSGHHGAALPGLIIERVHPKFLPKMLSQLSEGVVIVSGTNGKTTTTKMIVELLASQGRRVLTNRTGGNFVRGAYSIVAQSASATAKLPYDIAVFEQDEAYAVKFVKLVRPRAVVLLNVTRDQLDRFGEIDTTAALLQKVVDHTAEVVVLNDDDTRLNMIKTPSDVRAIYFGINKDLQPQFPNDEQLYGAEPVKISRHERLVELEKVEGSNVGFKLNGQAHSLKLLIDGQHNALNGAAALATVKALHPEAPEEDLIKVLSNIKAMFGRGELINFGNRTLVLQLVKNPASFRQALHVLDIHKPGAVGIIINDDHADGRDVSWLWDVDFQLLKNLPVITSGRRGADMANRLKYDEIEVLKNQPNLKQLPLEVLSESGQKGTAIIFATYTAMLAVRKAIARLTKLEVV